MATGERTQMRRADRSVGSPLRDGELPPQDEGPDLARREHAVHRQSRQAGSRRQDRRCSRRVTSASGRRDCSCWTTAHCAAVAAVASRPTTAGRRARPSMSVRRSARAGAPAGERRRPADSAARRRRVANASSVSAVDHLFDGEQAGGVPAALVVRCRARRPSRRRRAASPRGAPAARRGSSGSVPCGRGGRRGSADTLRAARRGPVRRR